MFLEMNPYIFTAKGISVRWYSLFILIAFITVYAMVRKESAKFKVSGDFIFNIAFWVFLIGIIGARLWFVLFHLSEFTMNPLSVFKIWEGGLAIHGGIIFGALTIFVFCKKYNFRFIRLIDFIAPALAIGQAIGRWGNFFNGEAHGLATTADILSKYFIPDFIIKGMTINGVVYMPTFLFESFGCLILAIVILLIRKYKYVKVGTPTAIYLIGYGIIRFFIEFQRTDALMLFGKIRMAQVISFVFFIIGLVILVANGRKNKLDDLYNDKENIPDLKY